MKLVNLLYLLFLMLVVSACGGGGGSGGNGGGGGGNNSNYSISTDVSSLNFIQKRDLHDDSFLPEETINITYKGDGVIVGFPPNVPEPDWIAGSFVLTDFGNGKASLRLRPLDSKSNSPRKLQTTIRFITGKADGSEYVYKDVIVNYELTDHLDIQSSEEFVIGASPDQLNQSAGFEFVIETWQAKWEIESEAEWLIFEPAVGQGVPFEEPQIVKVTVDPARIPESTTTVDFHLKQVDGDIQTTKTLTLHIDEKRYWFGNQNVAMSIKYDELVTERRVEIYSNGVVDLDNLTFVADNDWLSIEMEENSILLKADKEGLENGVYISKVDIFKDGTKVSPIPLTIGLYVNGQAVSDIPYVDTEITSDFRVISDPVRPYLYLIGNYDNLKIYDLYTGEVLHSDSLPYEEGKRYIGGYNSPYESYVSDDGGILYISNGVSDDMGSTGGEQPIYHRFDITEKKWLSDVSQMDYRKPIVIDGLYVDFNREVNFIGYRILDESESLNAKGNCIPNVFFENGTMSQRLAYAESMSGGEKQGISIDSPKIYRDAGLISCKQNHFLSPDDVPVDPIVSNTYSMSSNGEYVVVGEYLYGYSKEIGFSSYVSLEKPSIIQGDSTSYWIPQVLVGNNGHGFIVRRVPGEGDFITEYDGGGNEIRTIYNQEHGDVSSIQFSPDEKTLIVFYDWEDFGIILLH